VLTANMKSLSVSLAIWLLRRKYLVSDGQADKVAMHELANQNARLIAENRALRMRAIITRVKSC
jgi:hypothetical protein